MRIILSLSNYINLTGAELYTYELARELTKRECKVTILANQIGGEIFTKTINGNDIKVLPFFDHPELTPDLVISSQPLPTNYSLRFFPHAVHMQVLHSLFAYEEPIIHKNVRQYIAVRPEIKDHWIKKYPTLKGKTSVIWNGIDTARFNEDYKHIRSTEKVVLFVGTVDHLRQHVIEDLVSSAIKEKSRLWLVTPFELSGELPSNITAFPSRWDVEFLVKKCDETAGIFVGRTTIEGFICGKPGIIYDVDEAGKILKKYTMGVPENREMFDIKYMTDKIIETYTKVRYDKSA